MANEKYCTIKLCVTAKKSIHEIKTMLKDAVVLLKVRLKHECQNAELVGKQTFIHFLGVQPKYSAEFYCFYDHSQI